MELDANSRENKNDFIGPEAVLRMSCFKDLFEVISHRMKGGLN